jgi:CYTH domain-containing protein
MTRGPEHNPRNGHRDVSALPDLSGASFGKRGHSIDISQSTEIELKFFVPAKTLETLIHGMDFDVLQQHYFSRDEVKRLRLEYALHKDVQDSQDFSVARIRRTKSSTGEISHLLEFKGRKEELCRREYGIPLSRKEYKELLERASAGCVEKRRFEIEGSIEHNGSWVKAVAQVDVLLKAGRPPAPLATSLTTIDIELPSVELAEALRSGKHSFRFLERCIDISADETHAGKSLTTRKLAKYGLDKERRDALRELESVAKRLCL